MILKKHTNELLKVISEKGFNLNDYNLDRRTSSSLGEVAVITYKKSPMEFWIFPGNSEANNIFTVHYTRFLPTFPRHNNPYRYNFEELKNIFEGWLKGDLSEYIENENEIDYWKLIKENPFTIEGIDFTKDEPFTLEEQVQLKLGLEEIKTLVSKKFELNHEQIEKVNKRIDYLIGATKRVSKIDWRGIAISYIMETATDLALDEQKRSIFFGLFSKLWSIVQHLPPHL